MATAKSLEDMLSSEVDESAVSALVGSLESQLSSSSIHLTSQDINTTSVTLNHVKNATVVDGGVTRLHDGQKHGVNAVSQGISLTNSSKPQVVNSQIVDANSTVSTTSNSVSVMVTLPGALPASGYITQVTGPSQQTLFTSAVTGTATARPLSVNNQDIKIVYSPQPSVTQLNTTTVSAVNNATVYSQRNNLKIASVPNGSPSPVGMITVRPTQPLVTVAAVNPIIPGSTTSMSAIQNLANIASQQTPIVIPNACQTTTSVQQVVSAASQHHQPQVQVNIGNGKQVIAARMTVREQIEIKHTDKNGKQVPTSHSQVVSTPSTSIQSTAISQMNSGVIQVSNTNPTAKGHTQQTGQQVNVVTQVVSNPSIIPGVQIVNVNPARMGAPGISAQKTIAPRVVFSNPVRIAPQILAARPGAPGVQVSGQNTITLQPGMVRGAILVKTENGQLQVVNVAPSLPSSSSNNSIPGAATYRLQSIQPGAQGVRTVTPQQMTVTVPVSVSATGVKANQQATVTAPQAVVNTLLQQTSTLNAVNSRPATPSNTTPSGTQSQQTVSAKISGLNGNLNAPLTIQTTMANNQTSSAPSQMSPNTAKKKCKNFLSTLIRLASDQPDQVATNVRNLIQGLIDGTIQAEEFTSQLQKELNSSPQPCLVPFLKKNLPFLRHSLITKELTIEGVRPPSSPGTVILPTSTASLQQLQSHFPRQNAKANINRQLLLKENITKANQNRPGSQQTATQVRVMASAGSGTLTAQLLQPSQNVIAQRLVTPRLPATLVGQAKSLLVTAPANKSSIPGVSTAALSPATVGVLQAKSPALIKTSLTTNKDREKRSFSSLKDDDDINDVAAMGGVNLVEESQRILASNAEIVGMQIRSCKDESFLFTGPLQERINTIAERLGMDDVSPDVVTLISHAAQNRLKSFIEKLGVIAEHRVENSKSDLRYEVTHDVKGQLKFLDELDRIEKRRHEEQEREMLLRAAKSRSKLEDPEQLKLKQKAKEMQRAEMQERQYHDSNETALKAIGQRKRMKLDSSASGLNQLGVHGFPGLSNSGTKVQTRPRVKRVNLRDLLYLMEQERETVRTPLLYKSYMK